MIASWFAPGLLCYIYAVYSPLLVFLTLCFSQAMIFEALGGCALFLFLFF